MVPPVGTMGKNAHKTVARAKQMEIPNVRGRKENNLKMHLKTHGEPAVVW